MARLPAAGGADERAIAVGCPRGDSAKRAVGGPLAGAVAPEGESEDAAFHLLGEELRGEGEVEEEVRVGGGARRLLKWVPTNMALERRGGLTTSDRS